MPLPLPLPGLNCPPLASFPLRLGWRFLNPWPLKPSLAEDDAAEDDNPEDDTVDWELLPSYPPVFVRALPLPAGRTGWGTLEEEEDWDEEEPCLGFSPCCILIGSLDPLNCLLASRGWCPLLFAPTPGRTFVEVTPDVEPELDLEGVTIVRRSSKFFRGSAEVEEGFFTADTGFDTCLVFLAFPVLLRYSLSWSLLLPLEVSLWFRSRGSRWPFE